VDRDKQSLQCLRQGGDRNRNAGSEVRPLWRSQIIRKINIAKLDPWREGVRWIGEEEKEERASPSVSDAVLCTNQKPIKED
jgi:hypothetical protein